MARDSLAGLLDLRLDGHVAEAAVAVERRDDRLAVGRRTADRVGCFVVLQAEVLEVAADDLSMVGREDADRGRPPYAWNSGLKSALIAGEVSGSRGPAGFGTTDWNRVSSLKIGLA
jgi:hypothetical protein